MPDPTIAKRMKTMLESTKVKAAPSSDIDCPETTASFFSKMTFSWLNGILMLGWKRPLVPADIYKLPSHVQAANLSDTFEQAWKEELNGCLHTDHATPILVDGAVGRAVADTPKKMQPSLRRAITRVVVWDLLPLTLLRIAGDVCAMTSPFMLKLIIGFVTDSKIAIAKNTEMPPLSHGFGYAIALFVLQFTSTLLQNQFLYGGIQMGIKVRVALSTMIYRKSLRLSAASRQDFNAGKVTNLISTDMSRFEIFFALLSTLWTAAIQVVVIAILLVWQIGPAAFAGVGIIALFIPLQLVIMRMLTKIRSKSVLLTDSRVKLTQEIFQGIRVLKFFTWEIPFIEQIESIRKKEIVLVFKKCVATAFIMTFSIAVPGMAASIAFIIYSLNNILEPGPIFSSLAWFNQLPMPLWFLPQVVVGYAEVSIALKRMQALLLAPELEAQPDIDPNAEFAIEIKDGEFLWDSLPQAVVPVEDQTSPKIFEIRNKSKTNQNEATQVDTTNLDSSNNQTDALPNQSIPCSTLRNINIQIPRGKLVAVVGPVGSGKSSLLNAFVGEMKQLSGTIQFSARLGYASQQAWIQNANIKDNILFGQPYDEKRYIDTVRACSLERDLKILPDGDRTQIGERGINLSGGQKQRVNLARMVYFNSDIVLLDDPLSAVDAHVGRDLFENCIQGALSEKTRILVTHQLHFLPKVDYIIVMSNGEIKEQGTYSKLMENDGEFSLLMKNYGGVDDVEDHSIPNDATDGVQSISESEKPAIDSDCESNINDTDDKDARQLMQSEDRATGTVDGKVWMTYFRSAGGIPFIIGLVCTVVLAQGAITGSDVWLVFWTNQSIHAYTQQQYVTIYGILAILAALLGFVYSAYLTYFGTRAAQRLHEAATRRIVRAPTLFFDTTPLGRIINRFSKDQDGIDNTLIESFRVFLQTFLAILSVFAMIMYATPMFAIVFVPVICMYYLIQLVYRSSSRELKRLDALARSPMYAQIGETLNGIATIRAYREQDRFIKRNYFLFDQNTAPYYLMMSAGRWMSVRFEFFGALLVFSAASFGLISRANPSFTPALLGLSLSYSLQVTNTLNRCIRQFTDTEINMNAVERVNHYANEVEVEAAEITDVRPPPTWPAVGTVEFRNLSMKYAPDLPLVLKNVSFCIGDKEKIGVVGRTGSGKSSLVQALFRMVEATSGSIVVDGISIQEIGLKDLRSNIGIIPQDPVLFSGTFRRNLDPFGQFTDSNLWDALERANIKYKVSETEGNLDGHVQENGDNLSVGQRQLICLARAMLKRPRILIMDEATANVDYETDVVIQKCLREDFVDSTVLTIAHRLNTIMDYDRVLVMNAGEIAELDTPKALMANEQSVFRSMVNETGQQNVEMFLKMLNLE
ncbi:hypothetical protein QVD99_001987 [Batrachochytrium dendrobatidis]|nr:hypothetical protein O5D80_000629 [Batrachochytrium dendrobatidis]KAK5672184.1 hypothetical protein QVD99_001987 [Batrachochytrium dendrobatidis]